MICVTPLEAVAAHDAQARALALGNFDGLHRGHQQLLTHAVRAACAGGLRASAMVFEPHPREVLHPERAPQLLTLPGDRAVLMDKLGLEELIVVTFDRDFSLMEPEDFVCDVLLQRCHVQVLCVGDGYRFGAGGRGDVALLRSLAERHNFEIHEMPLFRYQNEVVSSSVIRQALAEGQLERAIDLLGHTYSLCGTVVHGSALARELGFPTANLAISPRCLLPRFGAYMGDVNYRDALYHCLINIGVRPSVDGNKVLVEAHLLDFAGDLYGETLCVNLRHFMRPEQRFASLTDLQCQVLSDISEARRMLAI